MDTNYNKMFNDNKVDTPSEPKGTIGTLQKSTPEVPTSDKPKPDSKPKEIHAVVTNCMKLNVREKPSKESNVICILNRGDLVTINQVPDNKDEVPDEWAHIKLYANPEKVKNTITGFVMGEFIEEV